MRDEFLRRVARGRAGSDDRDAQRSELGRDFLAASQLRPVGADRVPLVVRGVDLEVRLLLGSDLVVGEDGVDRAFVDTGTAVDAGLRVDVEHLRRCERRLVGCRVYAVDRADFDARDVVTTCLGDHISHFATCLRVPGGVVETPDYNTLQIWSRITLPKSYQAATGGENTLFGQFVAGLDPESDLERNLRMGDSTVIDVAARVDDLEPFQVTRRLPGPRDSLAIASSTPTVDDPTTSITRYTCSWRAPHVSVQHGMPCSGYCPPRPALRAGTGISADPEDRTLTPSLPGRVRALRVGPGADHRAGSHRRRAGW